MSLAIEYRLKPPERPSIANLSTQRSFTILNIIAEVYGDPSDEETAQIERRLNQEFGKDLPPYFDFLKPVKRYAKRGDDRSGITNGDLQAIIDAWDDFASQSDTPGEQRTRGELKTMAEYQKNWLVPSDEFLSQKKKRERSLLTTQARLDHPIPAGCR